MHSKRIDVDTKTFIRFWLVILGFFALGFFVYSAKTGLIIVGISAFLAIAIQPLIAKFSRLLGSSRRSYFATALVYLGIVLGLGGIFAIIAPVIINETTRFISEIPRLLEQIGGQAGIDRFGQDLGLPNLSWQLLEFINSSTRRFFDNSGTVLVNGVSGLADIATKLTLVLVLTFLFLTDGHKIATGFWKLAEKQGEETAAVWRRVTLRLANVVSKYVSGQVTVALLDGFISALAIFILALIFDFSPTLALPLGLIAMVFYLIPLFGAAISCILVSLLIFFSSTNIFAGLAFLFFYIVYQQIENNIIAPKIQGNALKLPPLVILIAITIGIYMSGLVGAILAIPIAGCIKVLIEEYPNLRRLG